MLISEELVARYVAVEVINFDTQPFTGALNYYEDVECEKFVL